MIGGWTAGGHLSGFGKMPGQAISERGEATGWHEFIQLRARVLHGKGNCWRAKIRAKQNKWQEPNASWATYDHRNRLISVS
jgi:hypothetical protein